MTILGRNKNIRYKFRYVTVLDKTYFNILNNQVEKYKEQVDTMAIYLIISLIFSILSLIGFVLKSF